ncbi:MAG: prolyl oligopeptidase family serine peptidase [Crocinitomicaceae bacterium]
MRITLFTFFLLPIISFAQKTLTLEEIMAGNDFIGHQPNNIVWGPDNNTIYFKWKENSKMLTSLYALNIKSQLAKKIKRENLYALPIKGYQTNSEKSAFYFQNNDRLYFVDKKENKLIYQSAHPFRLFQVIDKNKVIISQRKEYFLFDHSKGVLKQCIGFKKNNESAPTELSYLEKQQIELFQFIRDENSEDKRKQEFDSIQNLSEVANFNLSSNSIGLLSFDKTVSFAILRTDQYPKNKNTEIEENITVSGYSQQIQARPKVGAENPDHQLFWIDLKTKKQGEIDLADLPGIKKNANYLQIFNSQIDLNRDTPKATICTQIIMNDLGTSALLEIKSYDNKDRWIAVFDIKSKSLKCVDHQHDDAWIGGPGISGWNMVPGNIGWMEEDNMVYFQSEKTGYSHLYSHNISGGKTSALTSGNFEIYKAELSGDGSKFYITSNKSGAANRSFYHFKISNKKWTNILNKAGKYEVTVSPTEDQLAIRYSYKNKPWELYTAANTDGAEIIQITNSQSSSFKKYNWREPDIVAFKNQKEVSVSARLFKPEDSINNGAAIQFVHGAGYLQNAHNWWSAYYREYMFHNLLCDLGYTVIDIDYTASEGYGRDFRTGIYRHMGGQDLDDQIAGRQYLIDKHGIDPKKVGIYGGSYGGFITIMALLKYPGYFQCGAAIRSVTDWAHYNHAYTSNILNTPETDSIAFRQSSPIYFANNLEDELLILHGMIDDNVQFQDVVRLNQRFIELGKKSFTMALYPVEPHGFVKTSSWIDEYSRILKLFNTHLR